MASCPAAEGHVRWAAGIHSILEALGNLGDFVGGLAVILTLLYLAFQVRQNTRSLRSAALDSTADRFSRTNLAIAQDADLADLIERGSVDYTALAGVERRRFRAYVSHSIRDMEGMFLKHREHLLPDSQFEGYQVAVAHALGRPGWRQCWEEISPIYAPEFRTFLNELIAKRDRGAPAV